MVRATRSRAMAVGTSSKGTEVPTRAEVKQIVKSTFGRNLEHKRAALILTGTATTSGTLFSLTQFVVEGDNINQRTGRQIRMDEVRLRYTRVVNSITNNTATLRTIVFLDTQNQGSYPNVTDVLNSSNPESAYENSNAQQGRFRILHDEFESLCASSNTQRKASTWVLPSRFNVHYGGGTDVPASNRRNAIFFLVLTDNTVSGPDYRLGVQLKFTDA